MQAAQTATARRQPTVAEALGPDPAWAKRIKNMHQAQLFKEYDREAKIHRDLMVMRAPMASEWRNFRQFMVDVGACPEGAGWVLSVTDDRRRVYEPRKVEWLKEDDPAALFWTKNNVTGEADWNRPPRPVAGAAVQPVQEDIDHLFTSEEAQRWLPQDPEKQALFKKAYALWRAQVKPNFRRVATPAFLFLYSTASIMRDLRNELDAAGLWNMNTARQDERDNHPAWIKYCDHLGRAQAALSTLDAFQDYSLFTELDALLERLIKSEQRYRMG